MNPDLEASLRAAIAAQTKLVRNRLRQKLRRDDVDDVLQDVLLAAMEALRSLRDPDAVRPWLLTLAEHKAVDHLRKGHRRSREVPFEHEVVDPDAAPSVADAAVGAEVWQFVMRCMQQLPAELQQPARRHFVFGESLAEVAKTLGRSKSTIQSQVEKVKAMLGARLTQAGHAAFVPMLEVVRPLPTDLAIAGALAGGGHRLALHGAAFLCAVVAIGGWWWAGRADFAPVAATEPSQPSAAGAVVMARDGASAPRDVPDVVREAVAVPVIHGRVADGTTGLPIVGAVVHAFDYVYRRELEPVQSGSDGTFCLEATRGQRRPFDVYVAPPDAAAHGRVRLGPILPAVDARSVVMVPPVDVRLTVTTDLGGQVPLRDVEVTVVDVSERSIFWPVEEGAMLRELLPPSFTTVERRTVAGALVDVLLPRLPSAELGVFLREPGGAIWFASPQQFAGPDGRFLPRKTTKTIRLFASGSWSVNGYTPRLASLRRTVCGPIDVPAMLAVPDWLEAVSGLNDAFFAGVANGDSGEEYQQQFDGGARLCWLPHDPEAEVGPARYVTTLRVSLPPFVGADPPRQASDPLVVLYRTSGSQTDLFGFARGHEPLVFPDVPVGEPLQLEVLSADLEHVYHRALIHVDPTAQGTIDVDAAQRTIEVTALRDGQPLPGCSVAIRGGVVEGRSPSAHRMCEFEFPEETDAAGRARLHVVGFDAPEVKIETSVAGGKVTVHASGAKTSRPPATLHHDFDFGVGFTLRIDEAGQPLQVAAGRVVRVEGEVFGDRRIAFRQVVESAADGVVRVFPGMVGRVQARLCVAPVGAEDARWVVVHAFEATSARFDRDVGLRLDLPVSPPVVPVVLRVMSVDGVALPTSGLGLEVRQPLPSDQRALADESTWQTLPWQVVDGVVECHVPMGASDAELRVRLPGHAPVVVALPAAGLGVARPVAVVLQPVREIAIGPELDKFEIDPDGLYSRGLRIADVVLAVGDLPITTRADLVRAIAVLPADRPVLLRVRRADDELALTLAPPWRPFLRWIERQCLVER